MRLSISNLAWGAQGAASILPVLAELGVAGIEVAPTRIAGWEDITDILLKKFRRDVESHGLQISSLQAICFGRPDLQLLQGDDARPLLEHFRHVGRIGATLGAEVAVFGAPKNRRRGEMPAAEAWVRSVERLYALGEVLRDEGIVLGIEPVPAVYECDFMTTAKDVLSMVKAVGHPNIRAHLDVACVVLGGGDIAEVIDEGREWIAHFHISQPQLGDFGDPLPAHKSAAAALGKAAYHGWVAIEMREQPLDNHRRIKQAVKFAIETYPIGRSR